MAPPFTYKDVRGTYLSPDGTAVSGQVRFIPSTTVYDTSGDVVVPPVPVTETLDGSGQFAVDLLVTDDPYTTPTGWVWRVTELFSGGREYEFELPSSSPSVVQITDLTPTTTVQTVYSYATTSEVQALEDRMNSLEATAVITTAAIVIHPFLLMGA